jgi:hypothetical protein
MGGDFEGRRTMTTRRSAIAAITIALALLLPLGPEASAQPEEKCTGPKDEIELESATVRVVYAKREAFIADVRTFAAGKSLGVGSATDEKGWIVLLLETRPYGVTIEVESVDANNFRAAITTCNATQDWRPIWVAFKAFIDTNRSQWSN